jgi:hypothetical protein
MPVQTFEIPSEETLTAMVQRATAGSWQAAAWLLANGPFTRAEWGNGAAVHQALQQQRLSFMKLIDQVDLTAHQRTALLEALAALPLESEAFDLAPGPDHVDLLEGLAP